MYLGSAAGRLVVCALVSLSSLAACEPLPVDGRGDPNGPGDNPYSCEGVECAENATCSGGGKLATCTCDRDYVGDGVTSCVPDVASCSPPCAENASCLGDAITEHCACDTGYFGDGLTACYPATTDTGTCGFDASYQVTCACNAGYEHAESYDVSCSDIDECQTADRGGCAAWCTNTIGGSTCTSTVADESSPYWANSCDPGFSHNEGQTDLPADCRCGSNKLVEGPLGLCQRPTSAFERGFRYGSGPQVGDLYSNFPRIPAGVMDQAARKIFLGFGYTNPSDSYIGAVMEIDVDSGDRRIVAGLWPDEFGGTVHGAGIAPYLPEVQNLAQSADGELYAWVRNVRNNAQIVHIDRTSGQQTVLWQEHLTTLVELNDPAYAQCPNGTQVEGGRDFVQIHERGFMVEPSGDFLLSAMSTNAGEFATPIGIVRIAKDGSRCDWVLRRSPGPKNDFTGQDIGSGAAPQPGIPFRAFYPHDGMIWAIDNFTGIYEIDPANGWRTRALADNLGEDWMAWDASRQVMWLAGSGGGSNRIVAYSPIGTPAERWAAVTTCINPTREGFPCVNGPLETCCMNHNPMFFDELKGQLIVQHDIMGTVRVEIETGNVNTFSL